MQIIIFFKTSFTEKYRFSQFIVSKVNKKRNIGFNCFFFSYFVKFIILPKTRGCFSVFHFGKFIFERCCYTVEIENLIQKKSVSSR